MAYILEKCPCTTVFLKTDTFRNPSFNWLLCVDQSILCVKALKNMKYFIKQGDSLSVVYVRKPGISETLCERYAEPVNNVRLNSVSRIIMKLILRILLCIKQ